MHETRDTAPLRNMLSQPTQPITYSAQGPAFRRDLAGAGQLLAQPQRPIEDGSLARALNVPSRDNMCAASWERDSATRGGEGVDEESSVEKVEGPK